jgi:phage antirepressor YoqD-like protein
VIEVDCGGKNQTKENIMTIAIKPQQHIISRTINNVKVKFDVAGLINSEDVYFNATEVAKQFKTSKGNAKDINEWLKSPRTKEYIKIIEKVNADKIGLSEKVTPLVITKKGFRTTGTWLHKDLAIEFNRWLDIGFSIMCDLAIKKLIEDHQNKIPHLDHKTIAQIENLSSRVKSLQVDNSTLQKDNIGLKHNIEVMKPYTNIGLASCNRDNAIEVGEFCKMLFMKDIIDIGKNRLLKWLREKRFLVKNGVPTQKAIKQDILTFKMSETSNYPITLITKEGIRLFSNLLIAEKEAQKQLRYIQLEMELYNERVES